MSAMRAFMIRSSFPSSVARRSFASSSVRAVGKESAVHEGEDRAHKVDEIKKKQQEAAKKGTNEWEHELASDSEAALKADEHTGPATKENIKKMQDQTTGKK